MAAGIWGTIAVAIFGNFEMMGVEKSRIEQLLIQLIGIGSIGSFCFFGSYIIFKTINVFFPLRVGKIQEELGLNISEHNASTDTHQLLEVLTKQAKSDDYSKRAPQDPFTDSGIIGTQYNVLMDRLEQLKNKKINGKIEFLKKSSSQWMFKNV